MPRFNTTDTPIRHDNYPAVHDASDDERVNSEVVGYDPANLADWNGSADPGAVDAALDQLSSRQSSTEAQLVTDHGALTGLADDDHAQYHNDPRGDARYYTKALLDAGQLDNRYFAESEHLSASTGVGDAGKPIKLDAAGHVDSSMINDADIAIGGTTGTLAIAKGGTGQTTAQAAIDALTAASGATNEHVLTKDTATGNAIFKAATALQEVVDDTTPTLGGHLDAAGFDITGLERTTSPFTDEGNLGTAFTFDFRTGNNFEGTLNANVTITVNDATKGLIDGQYVEIKLKFDVSQKTITWTGVDKWIGGTPTAPSTGEALIVMLRKDTTEIIGKGELGS